MTFEKFISMMFALTLVFAVACGKGKEAASNEEEGEDDQAGQTASAGNTAGTAAAATAAPVANAAVSADAATISGMVKLEGTAPKMAALQMAADPYCQSQHPNGVDAAAYPFVAPRSEQAANLLFLGKLDFRPNADAIEWFAGSVLRPLFKSVPNARLFAVGANPPRWLVEAGQHDDRMAVTGYVVDERSYLARCAALVLPLRTGGGTRLKALIAMASGLPVVSTRLGMEGLLELERDLPERPLLVDAADGDGEQQKVGFDLLGQKRGQGGSHCGQTGW